MDLFRVSKWINLKHVSTTWSVILISSNDTTVNITANNANPANAATDDKIAVLYVMDPPVPKLTLLRA